MKIHVLTIFPKIFEGFVGSSLIEKAQSRGLISISISNIRDFASPPHFQVDDTPFGGGAGMVMKPEPLVAAIEEAKNKLPSAKVILLSAAGERFNQKKATKLSHEEALILVCGRYEGVDQRVVNLVVDEEISIGDYVLMGGEVPAMALTEAVVRLVPGVVGNSESVQTESFSGEVGGKPLLEAPQYTKPQEFRGLRVPDALLTGNHAEINRWREKQSTERSQSRK